MEHVPVTNMKPIVIIGSAPCVIDDLERIPEFLDCDYAAVGLSGTMVTSWPLKFIATYHPEDIPQIKEIEPDTPIVSYIPEAGVDMVIPFKAPSGSSALLAVFAARILGYDKIILVGCPLQGKSGAGDDMAQFQAGWMAHAVEVLDTVRSMSGWTAEFLGTPTEGWINS